MNFAIECSKCGRFSSNVLDFKCDSCGQPLDTQYDLAFQKSRVRRSNYSVWRYADSFPYARQNEIVTLGEGWTPLVKFSENILFKLESLNPTGSFKDRGSTTLVSAISRLLKKAESFIAEDSSGNAGASIAAYAARAGLKAKIYVPETISGPKFDQIQFYGAEVIKVSGGRSKVAEEAQKTEQQKNYIGHILHPLFRDGIRSLAYEVAEQLDWHIPDRIYMPVSAGTLLLGAISGFEHLLRSNIIETMPKIVACQTKQVSPLYHRFKGLKYDPPEKLTSIADALASVNPPLLDLMTKRLMEAGGDVVMIDENEIRSAFKELARKGFYVEPSSAVAYAGYIKQLKSRSVSTSNKTVIVLTGNGLKTALKPN